MRVAQRVLLRYERTEKNEQVVKNLYTMLEQRGYKMWFDLDRTLGQHSTHNTQTFLVEGETGNGFCKADIGEILKGTKIKAKYFEAYLSQ